MTCGQTSLVEAPLTLQCQDLVSWLRVRMRFQVSLGRLGNTHLLVTVWVKSLEMYYTTKIVIQVCVCVCVITQSTWGASLNSVCFERYS